MTGYSAAECARRRLGASTIGTIACAAAVLLASPSSAHHSFSAEFDATRQIKITGEVYEVEWTNPHAWVHVRAKEMCERRGSGSLRDTSSEAEWACRAPGADEAP